VQASQNNWRLAFRARPDTEGVMSLQIAGQEIARPTGDPARNFI
jgi:hypothetical protein